MAMVKRSEGDPACRQAGALGHPLGCTGTKLTLELLNEMRRRKQKYGVVTIPLRRDRSCVGTGQGAASVFELLN
jgi:acetyl-CoA acyltransferase